MHAAEHQGESRSGWCAVGSAKCNVERHFVGSKRVFNLAEPRRNDQKSEISLRQMPLPALIAAAQEIEIKGVFRRLARVRAR